MQQPSPSQFRRSTRALAAASAAALSLAGCWLDGSDGSDGNPSSSVTAAQACTTLRGQTVAGAVVSAATEVAATADAPLYCKVTATIAPALNLELRLPQQWNGKLYQGGGGGYNGSIPALAGGNLTALKQGYATVNSDSGHTGDVLSASFALNDPAALALFGNQSVPTVAAAAKEMLRTAYGQLPTRSYFEGCSNGGREALMAAQRNPTVFDGIIARAPAYNWTGVMGAFNRNAQAQAVAGGQFNAAKLQLLATGVRTACDALDGIADGVVSHPSACTTAQFNPQSLRCAGGTDLGDTCLSDAQLGVVNSWTMPASFVNGSYTNTGWRLTGNEDDAGAWPAWLTGPNGSFTGGLQYLFQDTTVKNVVAHDAGTDSLTYPWEQNPAALATMASIIDATVTDLRPLSDHGAKLILWHGLNDAALSASATEAYYQGVVNSVGGQANADAFVRFYEAPGVNHCSGGPGADAVDLLTPLDLWVTQNTAPGILTATRGPAAAPEFSRPLCQYPQYPRYTGPANDPQAARLASNYSCTAP